ncbi:hypothetical protein GCN78_25705 [Janthinobacterium rivuli]|uniref:HNH endonuclease n=1 Tax=Janthinobacterium sp. FT68W TaxID=2654255 RepID=UPI001264BD89|nr:HNH endonuclease [Janthinobacterium sp. FT68W]KAB8046227.1 hypothetical protein GCN78_25705 [Janthinobacterium sp. FT68W]
MIYLPKSSAGDLAKILQEAMAVDRSGVYRDGPVYERLKADFHGKCYICEDDEMTAIQIEHFEPHKNVLVKKYSWENLFYSCGHCNNTKNAGFWPMLDCTEFDHEVWESLNISLSIFPKTEVKISLSATCPHPEKGQNTIRLLEKVYNGKDATAMKTDEARILRNKILRAHTNFVTAVAQQDVELIWKLISDNAAFSGIMRWWLRNNHPKLYTELLT